MDWNGRQQPLVKQQLAGAPGTTNPAHLQQLLEHKRAARTHRGCDRLARAAPAAATLLERAAARGDNLGSITAALLRLLDRYGAWALQPAIVEALQRGVPHPNAVRLALERRREAAGHPPPTALVLPEHVARRDAPVRPHALDSYDRQPDSTPATSSISSTAGTARAPVLRAARWCSSQRSSNGPSCRAGASAAVACDATMNPVELDAISPSGAAAVAADRPPLDRCLVEPD